jgi:NHL repeat
LFLLLAHSIMSHTRSKKIFHLGVITAAILSISQCARLGEASVMLSEQNMLPAQQVETGITKPGMGSAGGPSTWSFWVKNRQAASDAMLGSFTPFYKVSAIRLSVSAHFVFYRDALDAAISSAQASAVLTTMENAYNNLKNVYGGGEHPYTNDGARIVILAYNIQDDYATTGNYVGGYFSPRDLFSNRFTTALFTDPVAVQQYSNLIGSLGGYSNEMSIINYDLNPGYSTNSAQVNDIVIHELSHLFTYNKRVMKQRLMNHDLWIAEGIAENAPDQTQGGLPANTHAVQQLRLTQLASPSTIDYYQDAPQLTDFLTWAPKIVGYLQSNLFFNYLRHRAEINLAGSATTMLTELMTLSDQTLAGVDTLIAKYIPGSGFSDIYADFVTTHYLMMLGVSINNLNGTPASGVRYSMSNVGIGNSTATVAGAIKSKYSNTIPFNFEAPKCSDGSYGLKPNSYVIFRYKLGGDFTPPDTAGVNPVAGELPLLYVVNLAKEIDLISATPPTSVSLITVNAGNNIPVQTGGYGLGGGDIVQVIAINRNKTGSCRLLDNSIFLRRNHSKWAGFNSYGTQASPDFDWQTDTGAPWANNQNGGYNRPSGIGVFTGGTPYSANFIYAVDYNNMSLQRLDLEKGTPMGRLGNTSITCPTTGVPWDSSALRFQNGYCAHNFDSPQGVYVHPLGAPPNPNHEIFVADSNNHRIVKYDQAGNFVNWLGLNGTCSGGWQPTGSVASPETLRLANAETDPCMFWLPWALTSDGTNLFIVDKGKHRILVRARSTGNYVGYLGNGQNAWNASTALISFGTLSGSAAGYFDSPRGITITGGNLYVADESNNRIVRINVGTGQFSDWIGNGSDGWKTSWTGPALPGAGPRSFNGPAAITTDGTYLYIADRMNNRISRWAITGGTFEGWIGHGKIGWEKTASAPSSDPYAGVSYYPADYYAEPQGLAIARSTDKGTKRTYLFLTSVYNGRITRINLDCVNAPGSSACDQLYDPLTP